MNTGTPLDLTPFGSVLQGIGLLYWLTVLAAVTLVLWKVKGLLPKILFATVVLAITVGPVAVYELQRSDERQQSKARLDTAMARFQMRCKSAGETIDRTVENVDGLFIVNQRPKGINFADQYKLDDPYGETGSGDNYIRLFLRGRPTRPLKIGDTANPNDLVRYQFVETASEDGGSIFRYTTPMGKVQSESVARNGGGIVPLDRRPVTDRTAKYGIAWADISTQEDRSLWIAGSRLQIIDLVSRAVIAERIGYMFDRGLGDTNGGRSPWAMARENACPPLDESTFYFFDRVLKSTMGETN